MVFALVYSKVLITTELILSISILTEGRWHLMLCLQPFLMFQICNVEKDVECTMIVGGSPL